MAPLPARSMKKCIMKGLVLNCRAGENTDPEYRGLAVLSKPAVITKLVHPYLSAL